jgi:hypothetical protein
MLDQLIGKKNVGPSVCFHFSRTNFAEAEKTPKYQQGAHQ